MYGEPFVPKLQLTSANLQSLASAELPIVSVNPQSPVSSELQMASVNLQSLGSIHFLEVGWEGPEESL